MLKGIKSFKPAFARLGEWCHTYYRQGLRDGSALCDTCGLSVPARISRPEEVRELTWLWQDLPKWIGRQSERLVNMICPRCGSISCIALEGLVISLPEGRNFSHTHQRIHLLPYRSIEFAGRLAVVTRFESMTEFASFEVISDSETYETLKIIEGGK